MNNSNKQKSVDIDSIISKVSKLPIPDKDKIDLLTNFKQNMMMPSLGEDENINRLQQKYNPPNMSHQMQQLMMQPGMNMYQPHEQGMNMMGYGGNQLMTVAHFDVLKNKMDTIQMELIDLLRHVKDYTQRYMTSTRQVDMEKIDEYIRGLFDVDKKMRDIKEQQSVLEESEPIEKEETVGDAKQGVLTRATNGIKNFFGSIGDNVSSVAGLVSDTANAANGFLSKPLLGKGEEEKNKEKAENEKASSNKNIVSIGDYISSNMNSIENVSNKHSNSNTLNKLSKQPVQIKEPIQPNESISDEDKELTQTIEQINDKMNQEIDNTVSKENVIEQEQNKGSSTRITEDDTIQTGGGKYADRLTRKIKLLKLKLTEKRLEKHLADATKTYKKHNTNTNTNTNNQNLRKKKHKKTMKN
jgi:hypothetical protein